jgi:Mor family transcriptional regulator
MTKQGAQMDEREARMGRRVSGKVSVLLTEIEKEDIPDRLLELARKLQDALNEKIGG